MFNLSLLEWILIQNWNNWKRLSYWSRSKEEWKGNTKPQDDCLESHTAVDEENKLALGQLLQAWRLNKAQFSYGRYKHGNDQNSHNRHTFTSVDLTS